jgi:AraC-like DNA-binding protein
MLGEIVQRTAHPLWVIDATGAIAFANPAAVGALGYRNGGDLVGAPSHATLHHSRADGSPYPASDCPVLHAASGAPRWGLEWFFGRDGRPFLARWASGTLPTAGGNAILLSFTRLDHAPSTAMSADGLSRLESWLAHRFRDPAVTPDALARENHLSLRAVQLAYARLGSSPAARIRDLRLTNASELLTRGATIHDAWEASGFLDGGTFTRAFKRRYAMTPSDYRQAHLPPDRGVADF